MLKTDTNKSWIVFHTRCGSFVSKKKMTHEEALAIWNSAHITEDFFDAFGLSYNENFIFGIASNDKWTLKEAEKYANEHDRKLYEELSRHIQENERK